MTTSAPPIAEFQAIHTDTAATPREGSISTSSQQQQQQQPRDNSREGLTLLRVAHEERVKKQHQQEEPAAAATTASLTNNQNFTYLNMVFDIFNQRCAGTLQEPTRGSRPTSSSNDEKKRNINTTAAASSSSLSAGAGAAPTSPQNVGQRPKSVSFRQEKEEEMKREITAAPAPTTAAAAAAEDNTAEETDPEKAKEEEAALRIQCAQRQRLARQEVDKRKQEEEQQQQQSTPKTRSLVVTDEQQQQQQSSITVTNTTTTMDQQQQQQSAAQQMIDASSMQNKNSSNDNLALPSIYGGRQDSNSLLLGGSSSLPLSPNPIPADPPPTPAVMLSSDGKPTSISSSAYQGEAVPTAEPLATATADDDDVNDESENQKPFTARTLYTSTGRFGVQLSNELKPTKLAPHPPKTSRSLMTNNNNNNTSPSTADGGVASTSTTGEVLAQEEFRGINSPPRARRFLQTKLETQTHQHVSPTAPRMSGLPDDAVDRANVLVQRANRLIERANNNSECDWNEVRELFFRAGTLYQDAQLHEEAGNAFSNAASVSRAVGDAQEVAAAASFAVDSLRESDPTSAIQNLLKLIDAYEQSGNRLLLAREAKNLAQMYEEVVEDKENALKYYTMANQIYAERTQGKGRDGGTKSLYISTMKSMAFLGVELGRYKYTQTLSEELSRQQPGHRTQWLLLACLCAIAEGNDPEKNPTAVIARAKRDFDNYQDRERAFQSGFEYNLVKGILEAWERHSLATYDQAQGRYESGRGVQVEVAREKGDRLAACFAALLEVCRENLFEFLRPYL